MSRKDKIAVMVYKAIELYLIVYPAERGRLKKLTAKRISNNQ